MQTEYGGALDHYLNVRDGRRPPRYVAARALPVAESGDEWSRHAAGLERLREVEASGAIPTAPVPYSLLDLKIALGHRALHACDLCPHHCRVDRNAGRVGYCGVAADTYVHWEGILCGEERELVPSHEVFLSGCTMRCAFCYSHEHITNARSGQLIAPEELARCAASRRSEGATNLNLVGGEPTVHLPNLLRALRTLDPPTPVVWNSNMYATAEACALLDGLVDLFLGDIHFGNDACARRLGRIPEYLSSITAAFRAAVASGASVIIRHLVMPGHLECCARPALEWAAREFPQVPLHLMFQYVPDYRAVHDLVLGRFLTAEEVARAQEIARELGVLLYDRGYSGIQVFGYPGRRPLNTRVPEYPNTCDTVDILVRPDGRVGFMRLLEELVPVAEALAGGRDE